MSICVRVLGLTAVGFQAHSFVSLARLNSACNPGFSTPGFWMEECRAVPSLWRNAWFIWTHDIYVHADAFVLCTQNTVGADLPPHVVRSVPEEWQRALAVCSQNLVWNRLDGGINQIWQDVRHHQSNGQIPSTLVKCSCLLHGMNYVLILSTHSNCRQQWGSKSISQQIHTILTPLLWQAPT